MEDTKWIRLNFKAPADTIEKLSALAGENAGDNLSLMLRKLVERSYEKPAALGFYPPKKAAALAGEYTER